MKRTLTAVTGILILAVSAQAFGQCPGGRCGHTASCRTPRGYDHSNQCRGGNRNTGQTAKPQTEPPAGPEPETGGLEPYCRQVIDLVNRARAQAGLPPFIADTGLSAGCGNHSRYMRSYGFGHADGGGLECIAYGVSTPRAVVSLWLNSDGHRAILLGRGSKIGVGFSGTFWTLRVR